MSFKLTLDTKPWPYVGPSSIVDECLEHFMTIVLMVDGGIIHIVNFFRRLRRITRPLIMVIEDLLFG